MKKIGLGRAPYMPGQRELLEQFFSLLGRELVDCWELNPADLNQLEAVVISTAVPIAKTNPTDQTQSVNEYYQGFVGRVRKADSTLPIILLTSGAYQADQIKEHLAPHLGSVTLVGLSECDAMNPQLGQPESLLVMRMDDVGFKRRYILSIRPVLEAHFREVRR